MFCVDVAVPHHDPADRVVHHHLAGGNEACQEDAGQKDDDAAARLHGRHHCGGVPLLRDRHHNSPHVWRCAEVLQPWVVTLATITQLLFTLVVTFVLFVIHRISGL